jgi:hypothetical protein
MNSFKNQNGNTNLIVAGIIGIIAFIAVLMFLIPTWSVWQQNMKGKAKLARATQERQILVEQARAEDEAADFIVNAITKVGKAAKEFPEYRKQVFMQAYAEALNSESIEQIIYVATEAGIPITEAGRIANSNR